MKAGVVLDTNVFVSALRSQLGSSYKLLSLVGGDAFEIAVSVPLVLEYVETDRSEQMSTISLRLPDSLHKRVRELAKQENVSMNQFIATEVPLALQRALKLPTAHKLVTRHPTRVS